ncbi:MAG: histidinol dehydrogenase [Dehalococcoidia bacterium]
MNKNTYKSWFNKEEGYGENFTPIEKVGVYIPTNLVSTVLMTVIPAKNCWSERYLYNYTSK